MSHVGAASVLAEYPKTVVLKDGAHLVLRPWRAGDPDPVAALPAAERAPQGVGSAEGDRITVLAVDGERVVAAATLHRTPGDRSRATLDLTLDAAYRGRRLGTWLLLDLVHLAAGLGVERLLAVARAGDDAYLAALRRLDFSPEPARPAGARLSPDSVVLAKVIHTAWTDF